jgi:pyruvate formate lyase activating enzyme
MKEALLYDKTENGNVKCRLCPHMCDISPEGRGRCKVRENREGVLYSLVYGRPCAMHVDPIEKKPLFHFLPGSNSYSVSTLGCNLKCKHCQNWQISQKPITGTDIGGEETTPGDVVKETIRAGCKSISYTYTEPTVFMEYALDISKLAMKEGIRNVFVSNGYMTEDAVKLFAPYVQADNVDLKSFSDRFYKEVCQASLEPVLSTLKRLVRSGVWVEVTTLIIPTINDDPNELKQIAQFIKDELGGHIPWHVSAFHPEYKLAYLPPTQAKTIKKAHEIGKDEGLKFVYAGNMPHGDYENTYCQKCGQALIIRRGFQVTTNEVIDGKCRFCGEGIEGVWV